MSRDKVSHEIASLRHRIEALEYAARGEIPHSQVGNQLLPDLNESPGDGNCSSTASPTWPRQSRIKGGYLLQNGNFIWADWPVPTSPTVRASIDSSTNDDGALGSAYKAYKQAHNIFGPFRHSSTAEAFSNLRAGIADCSILVGHGNSGHINTGSGQLPGSNETHMDVSNQSSWTSIASLPIPKSTRLVLFGCDVASGTGSRFLQLMANVVRKEVGAWNGLCNCGELDGTPYAYGTGEFVTVKPGGRLNAVTPIDIYMGNPNLEILRLRIGETYQDIPIDAVKQINFSPCGVLPRVYRALTLTNHDIKPLVQWIDFASPMSLYDKPLSILIGLLTITFEYEEELFVRAFRVLGELLIQDVCSPNIYYYTSRKMQELFRR
jgi:hypothetical protein